MHLSSRAKPSVSEYSIPEGRSGVIATLKLMRQIVHESKRDPDVIALARDLISRSPEKDWYAEIDALFSFVRDEIRYTLDVRDVETLTTPMELVALGHGDCDDKSILLASLLESVGHPARFVAVGFAPGELSHVYVETRIGTCWIALDATEAVDVGWKPDNVQDRYTVNV